MNCGQVKELLSAYLDNKLALGETGDIALQLRCDITTHLRTCRQCGSVLADFHRFDVLLSQIPRVDPSPFLHHSIYSSPEYLKLTHT